MSFEFYVKSSDEIELPDVEETGTTFEENALMRAVTGETIGTLIK